MNDSASSANERPADDELQWQAYRYVSGEMSPAEASVFEQQLERDLGAGDLRLCELVAQMTELGHAVVVGEATQPEAAQPGSVSVSPAPAREVAAPSRSQKNSALVAGGAVAAALLVAFFVGPRDSQHASVPPGGLAGPDASDGKQTDGGNQATRLVSLWRAADDEEGEDATGDDSLAEHDAGSDLEAGEHLAAGEHEGRRLRAGRSDYSVPVWLLAAVTPDAANEGKPESAVKPAAPMPGPSPEPRPQEN